MQRNQRPVFVIGCHRSGTNLLYDTLLSAGGFALYRGYIPIYKMLIPRFGALGSRANRERLLEAWLHSKGFRRSGLECEFVTERVLNHCQTGGDFIRITLAEVARRQGAARWALYDPDNVLFIPSIRRDIPEALFIHIVRDGRDIALSLRKMGGFTPLPWDRGRRSLLATALYWEWMVKRGRRYGRQIPDDYLEIGYESLVCDPRPTLATLGRFIGQDLDFEAIRAAGLGRVASPNSSFSEEVKVPGADPVQRWKSRLTADEVAGLEALVGACLTESGYDLVTPAPEREPGAAEGLMRAVYREYLDAKLWMKTSTPLGRMANLSALELDDADPGE